jgi:AraC-like DNA-binding protein
MQTDALRYREYPIHPALASFVKCIWSLQSDRAIYDGPRERILPDGCVELVFHFADPFRNRWGDGEITLQPRSFVVGQMRRFLEIEPSGRVGFIAVRFFVHGAYLFVDRPLSEAAGVADLDHLWPRGAREWAERIETAHGMASRVRIVQRALLGLLRQNGVRDPAVDRALQLITSAGEELNVARIAAAVGLSSRQLGRRFQNTVGLSPKEYVRISRFVRAVRGLSNRGHRTLTDLALASGYFDQAHFNHEFREMAGMTPRQFFDFPNLAF